MINFKVLATQLLEKFEKLTPYERYKWFLSQYYLATYKLGKENFRQTDCSGILSGALYLAGFNIRCTAQFFYDYIFLQKADEPFHYQQYVAAFMIDNSTGAVNHLSPHLENSVFINSASPTVFTTSYKLLNQYNAENDFVDFRCAPEKTLSAFSVSLLAATEIDKEIADLLGV